MYFVVSDYTNMKIILLSALVYKIPLITFDIKSEGYSILKTRSVWGLADLYRNMQAKKDI